MANPPDVRFPVLHNGRRGVDDGAIHVEEEAIKGMFLRWQAVVWLRAHVVGSGDVVGVFFSLESC